MNNSQNFKKSEKQIAYESALAYPGRIQKLKELGYEKLEGVKPLEQITNRDFDIIMYHYNIKQPATEKQVNYIEETVKKENFPVYIKYWVGAKEGKNLHTASKTISIFINERQKSNSAQFEKIASLLK